MSREMVCFLWSFGLVGLVRFGRVSINLNQTYSGIASRITRKVANFRSLLSKPALQNYIPWGVPTCFFSEGLIEDNFQFQNKLALASLLRISAFVSTSELRLRYLRHIWSDKVTCRNEIERLRTCSLLQQLLQPPSASLFYPAEVRSFDPHLLSIQLRSFQPASHLCFHLLAIVFFASFTSSYRLRELWNLEVKDKPTYCDSLRHVVILILMPRYGLNGQLSI